MNENYYNCYVGKKPRQHYFKSAVGVKAKLQAIRYSIKIVHFRVL